MKRVVEEILTGEQTAAIELIARVAGDKNRRVIAYEACGRTAVGVPKSKGKNYEGHRADRV